MIGNNTVSDKNKLSHSNLYKVYYIPKYRESLFKMNPSPIPFKKNPKNFEITHNYSFRKKRLKKNKLCLKRITCESLAEISNEFKNFCGTVSHCSRKQGIRNNQQSILSINKSSLWSFSGKRIIGERQQIKERCNDIFITSLIKKEKSLYSFNKSIKALSAYWRGDCEEQTFMFKTQKLKKYITTGEAFIIEEKPIQKRINDI